MRATSKYSIQYILAQLLKWSSSIILGGSVVILSYLSFVDEFIINPNLRNVTIIAIIAAILNWIIWDANYRNSFNRILVEDCGNTQYSIHKRYYIARRGWDRETLQQRITQYNKNYRDSWIKEVEDVTGRKEKDIREGIYKGNSHWVYIYRIKRRIYPKSGLRNPRDLLQALSIGGVKSGKIYTKASETHYRLGMSKKVLSSILSTLLAASLMYEFITENIANTLLKLLMMVSMLFVSFIFGAISGMKGARIKLSVAEELSELLEEWKGEKPNEVPFDENEVVNEMKDGVVKEAKDGVVKEERQVIELT